jgi:hypothetical protein
MPTGLLRPDETIFVDGIIHEANIKFGDKGGYLWLHVKISEELHKFLDAEILAHLSPEHHKEFLQMTAEHKSNDDVDRFLEKRMPNAKQVLTDAYAKFRRRL